MVETALLKPGILACLGNKRGIVATRLDLTLLIPSFKYRRSDIEADHNLEA